MKSVILLGTTVGTTWRHELIKRLVACGVTRECIINPHLPHGVRWTSAHMEAEREVKHDPDTLVLIYVCPAAVSDTKLDAVAARDKFEWLGPTSMKEIGQYGWSTPERTAIVLDYELFTEGRRPRKVLMGFEAELIEDFGEDGPPYFKTLAAAEGWIVQQLVVQ
jgi:hypothetical protein